MNARETCRLTTFHLTKIYYDEKRGVFHAAQSNSPEVFVEITDEALKIYSGDGDKRIYFSIDDTGKFNVASGPIDHKYKYNGDGTLSIIKGEKYLCPIKNTDRFQLTSVNVTWERFYFRLLKTASATGTTEMPVAYEFCAGCTACASVCPKGVITMTEDDEGFKSPAFDWSKCIDCGRCNKVCPIKNPNKHSAPDVSYAAWISDDESIRRSSSGGIAYVISKRFIEDGGVVCGAAMEGFVVKHIIVDKVDELKKLQGSKYVQSDLGNIFVEIKQLLKDGRKVLFTGTPCQVSGLRNFIGKGDENLTTIDLICHSTPSPGVFRRYINELRRRFPTAATVTMRDDIHDWGRDYYFSIFDDTKKCIFTEQDMANPYLSAFGRGVLLRRSCGHCTFTSKERVGDITVGDYWGIEKYDPALVNKSGTSLVFVNTEKGRKLYDLIGDRLATNAEVPSSAAIQRNLNHPTPVSILREKFFENYKRGGDVENYLIDRLYPVAILNLQHGNNMGAVIVAYALSKAVNRLGYSSVIIDAFPQKDQSPNFRNFLRAHLKYTAPCPTRAEFRRLNPTLKKIIVGSDQVWSIHVDDTVDVNALNWASGYKSFISYASSFGTTVYNGKYPKDQLAKLLQRFDFISVREDSGVDVCNYEFNVPAVHVVDPTMLLPREHYDRLIDPKLVVKPDNPYVAYMLFQKEIKEIKNKQILKDIREKYVLWNVLNDITGAFRTVSSWLAAIRDAEYVITNSFHGTVFSILFNKQFVTVQITDDERILSLFRMFGIPMSRYVRSLRDVSLKSFDEKLDYTRINPLIQKEREKGFMFLKMALSAPLNYKEPVMEVVV